jgi:hypothetical protein
MNARVRDKQAAYLAAMGREPEAQDPRGANVVELRPAGTADSDEVTITYPKGAGVTFVRGKTTRRILADLCVALGREPRQLIATPTKQGGFDSAWIKATDGVDVGAKLAFVTGLTPTQINIVWGRPIERLEQVKGRFYPLGSSHAAEARVVAAEPATSADAELGEEPAGQPLSETDLAGDDE